MSTTKGGEEEKELTVDAVAEMIDTTFVNGCMQLAQGYVVGFLFHLHSLLLC